MRLKPGGSKQSTENAESHQYEVDGHEGEHVLPDGGEPPRRPQRVQDDERREPGEESVEEELVDQLQG